MKKKLPIGIQDFSTLIKEGNLYVDKTALIYQLIKERKGFFFSRPRRFGKSLLLSTISSIFSCDKELFESLWIQTSNYSWEKYPVIHLDLSRVYANTPEMLQTYLNNRLIEAAEQNKVTFKVDPYPAESFSNLIQALAKSKDVVILIDEYDHPILSNLEDKKLTDINRNILSDFFTVIKSMGKMIRFALVTGVSKFAKVSLFSGMNNLEDLSLEKDFATLAGITEKELKHYYTPYIDAIAKTREQTSGALCQLMKSWYNGYRFSRFKEVEKVYNPISMHMFLRKGELLNYWFGTATPTFAIQLIKEQNYPVVHLEDGVKIGASLNEHHETDGMSLIPLLFQTGYLTIADYIEETGEYFLKFPNIEVKKSFHDHLVKAFTHLTESQIDPFLELLTKSLKECDFEPFFSCLNSLLAEIPHPLHIAKEAYYHSLIYLLIRSLKFESHLEVLTSFGRLDLALMLPDKIVIMEFKLNVGAKAALKQLKEKKYGDRYRSKNLPIVLLGVNINSAKRSIDEWDID